MILILIEIGRQESAPDGRPSLKRQLCFARVAESDSNALVRSARLQFGLVKLLVTIEISKRGKIVEARRSCGSDLARASNLTFRRGRKQPRAEQQGGEH